MKPSPAHCCPDLYLKLLGRTHRFKVFQDLSLFSDDLSDYKIIIELPTFTDERTEGKSNKLNKCYIDKTMNIKTLLNNSKKDRKGWIEDKKEILKWSLRSLLLPG